MRIGSLTLYRANQLAFQKSNQLEYFIRQKEHSYASTLKELKFTEHKFHTI